MDTTPPAAPSSARRATRTVLWWLALLLHLVVGFMCLSTGLSIPFYVWFPLMGAWFVLLVVLIRTWRGGASFLAPLIGLILVAIIIALAEMVFGWTA